MLLFFPFHYEFVLVDNFLLLVHVLEYLNFEVRDLHSFYLLILNRLKAKLSHDILVVGLHEKFSQLHLVLSLDLPPSIRIDVFGSNDGIDFIGCRTLRLPIVVHELQRLLVLLLHLAIITWMPRHQVLG